MKKLAGVVLLTFLTVNIQGCSSSKNIQNQKNSNIQINPQKNLKFAGRQLKYLINEAPSNSVYPRSVRKNGKIRWVKAGDWTSGFFPGELWLMYKYTQNNYWKNKAELWTKPLQSQQYNTHTHDVGFMINYSYGTGYNLTHNQHYKQVVIQAARSLSTRFNPKVGAIKSWDHTKWEYPVIIDNMMNLQLLFHAWKLSGNKRFYHIAYQHALTTMRTHIRANGSSFHVVSFDTTTGKVLWKGTRQGYANNSTWARGEAWALYGFTMAYHYTKDKRFLKVAEKVAHYILTNKNLPSDDVPYWDYNAPNIPNAPRDASAAAIMGSGFLQLSGYVKNSLKNRYINTAKKIIHSLTTTNYRAASVGKNDGFILKKSVGSKPDNSEVSVPLIYADYFYIQANLRYLAMEKRK